MQPLEALVREAAALAATRRGRHRRPSRGEVARQMQICNACRYCEGFCAVFPAMTRRLEFGKADVHYLANLCHNCGACLHACQYAPPHEFAVNVPRAMAQVRRADLRRLRLAARRSGALYQRNGADAGARAGRRPGAVPGAGAGAAAARCRHAPLAGNFYACSRTICWWRCSRRCSCSRSWRWASACAASGATSRPGAGVGAPRSARRRATCCA